jgi:hypothetical protein
MNEDTNRIRGAVMRLQERLFNIMHSVEFEKDRYGQFTDDQMQEMLPAGEEKTPRTQQN